MSELLKGGTEILDFIDQILEELNKSDSSDSKVDFKTIAKLTASMNRTKSEKVRPKSEGGVLIGRVERSKSLKEKHKVKGQKRESNSLSEERLRSRLSSLGDLYNTDRRSTLGEVDVTILDEDLSNEDPFPKEKEKMDFKTLGLMAIGANNAAKGWQFQT